MHLQLGEISTVVVSSPELTKEVMKTHDVIFASRPEFLVSKVLFYGSTDIAFSPYGDYWRQLRKICSLELLSTKRVQSFQSIREEVVSNLIDWISSKAGSPIYLTDRLHSLTYGVTSRAAFGKRYKEQKSFVSIVIETTKLASGFNVADLFPSIEGLLQWISGIRPQLEKIHQESDIILENIISEHKKARATLDLGNKHEKNNEDLVDVLLKVQELEDSEFHLTTNNIKAVIWDVFGAGGEASATTIDSALSELMKNPRVMTKAQAEVREVFNRNKKVDETGICEMKFLKLVIKETLRLHPLGSTKRFHDSPIDYKGNDFEYIPFGAGRRICPGMSFGLANVELPLAMLLYHLDWKLPDGMKHEDLNMTETFGIVVRRKEDLYIVPHRYCPSFAA
ncbi:hypothetical protein EZV62_009205 [Acer yangbiense]|uniref:Cytochrome P450 n=1 Tax=Acer yangbiense TaxID=1000413 RepID=A0A5C7IF13_9ROSI|nr:hypothetical protein EZV62_009205 [Acer yangbiense]